MGLPEMANLQKKKVYRETGSVQRIRRPDVLDGSSRRQGQGMQEVRAGSTQEM
jgi:hypothetical protein